MRFATKAIRVGQSLDSQHRSVVPPLYQSATFGWESLSTPPQFDYTRAGSPNRHALEQVIASLEGGKHCVVFGSGMAAVQGAFALLKAGDHLLMASDIYGGTFRFAYNVLPRQGIAVSEFSAHDVRSLHAAARPDSRMVIFESPTNPTLRVPDIAAVAREARALGLISVFDNTFASPALQTPLALGVDVVLHSTTKYISGHSDVIGGALVTSDDAHHAFVLEYIKTVGSVPSPFDCWLSLRGVKTLACRMPVHCGNARRVAEYLASHPRVRRVHYPGLPSHPDHPVAKRQMRDFGGMVSFEVDGTPEEARRVAESTSVFMLAESLGGVESLVGYPTLMSHGSMSEEQRLARGIGPTLIRLSVGIEDPDDLIADLEQALAARTAVGC